MKKSVLSLITVALLFFAVSVESIANETIENKSIEKINNEAISKAITDINQMVERVAEINKMDIESLNKSEKNELRKELRTIRNDLKNYSKSDSEAIAEAAATASSGGGLYISGAAIIIILLLIILL